jgi:Flp pilus assembly pilin Flp
MKRLVRNRRGAALVEYSLLIAGIALIGAAAVSTFGHKTSDMIGAVAAVMPGAHADDNQPMASGKIIETAANANGDIALDVSGAILTNSDGTVDRLGLNVTGDGATGSFGGLVNEVQ